MTRAEMINKLESGKKMKHEFFSDHEYIVKDDYGIVRDEEEHNFTEGMQIRKGGNWETGWSEFQEDEK